MACLPVGGVATESVETCTPMASCLYFICFSYILLTIAQSFIVSVTLGDHHTFCHSFGVDHSFLKINHAIFVYLFTIKFLRVCIFNRSFRPLLHMAGFSRSYSLSRFRLFWRVPFIHIFIVIVVTISSDQNGSSFIVTSLRCVNGWNMSYVSGQVLWMAGTAESRWLYLSQYRRQ